MNLHRSGAVFFAKFFAIFLFLEFLVVNFPVVPLQEFIARTLASFLGLGYSGSLVFVSEGAFEITASCTGLVSASVLAAIIFSLKKPELKEKAVVFAAGFVALLVVNYFRVLLVLWSGKEFGIAVAEIVHVLSWFVTSGAVIAAWYFFTKKTAGIKDFSGFL